MFEFIHAADIHLDSPLRGLERYEGAPVEEIRLATRRALENLVSLALERQVAFVLIAGDLFDGDWKDYNTGLFFARQMARLREALIPVYIVKGNHDAANKITRSLKMPDNVHVFAHSRPETFLIDETGESGVAIHGQSFSTAATLKNLAQDYPPSVAGRFNIGVLHTCATGREGHETYAPCTVADLKARGYDYWALGHVHKREVLAEEPLVVFPGNIQGRHIRETGPKGCTIVSVDDRGKPTAFFEELDVLRWEHSRVDVSETRTAEEVLERVEQALSELADESGSTPMAVRVELTGSCQADAVLRSSIEHWTNQVRAVAADCGRDRLWVEKVKIRTTPERETTDGALNDGPVAEFFKVVEEMQKDEDERQALKEELLDLEKKLTLEVKELMGWNSEEFLPEMLTDVKDILMDRLSRRK